MIYCYGVETEITAARVVPVWIEQENGGRIVWHYDEPKKPKKKSKVTLAAVVFVKATWKDRPKQLNDGKWRGFMGMAADDGFAEIDKKCAEVSPDEMTKYGRWLKGELSGEVFDHFPRIDAKDVA
jgi:hypothetical protein